ncbi:MAG: hypothetical protein R6U66_08595, partial [Bacteroidales bacterium]
SKAEKVWYRKDNNTIAGIFLILFCLALILKKGDAQKIAAIAYSVLLLALFVFGVVVYYLKRARFKRVAEALGISLKQLVELIKFYG